MKCIDKSICSPRDDLCCFLCDIVNIRHEGCEGPCYQYSNFSSYEECWINRVSEELAKALGDMSEKEVKKIAYAILGRCPIRLEVCHACCYLCNESQEYSDGWCPTTCGLGNSDEKEPCERFFKKHLED